MNPETLSAFDYSLPPDLIAEMPLPERDASRLLCLGRRSGSIEHRTFREFPTQLRSGDLLVLNETRVVPAKLNGHRTATGGKWDGLFLGLTNDGHWRLIGQTRGKLQPSETITLHANTPHTEGIVHGGIDRGRQKETDRPVVLTLIERLADGEWTASCDSDTPTFELLDQIGSVPLPSYIERDAPLESDRQRYQTVFAKTPGAVAAPTAGLHFTSQTLDQCRQQGVEMAHVTLHVGLGTFRPVSVENLAEHRMHHEWCELPSATVEAIAKCRARGGRIIAVGTTSVRTLESVAALSHRSDGGDRNEGGDVIPTGDLTAWSGETNLFIRPPYKFRVVDGLLTNFHLPKSTLLMLVSAFAGRESVMSTYASAIAEQYRFFSYGDAMFIVDE